MKPKISLRRALSDENLLGKSLRGPSWRGWRILLIAAMGEPLTEDERPIFTELTGRSMEPLERCEELVCVIGRRGGKTEAVATLGAYLAACCDYSDVLVPGETGVLMVIAADQEQAVISLDRIEAKLRASPLLRQLIKSSVGPKAARTQKQLRLSNGILVQVRSSSYRKVRGFTLCSAIADEIAFFQTDEAGANPDVAICQALRPALSTTGGLLAMISSPYSKKGELYTLYRKYYGPDGDPRIIVAQAASRVLNPTLPQSVVDRAMARDPMAASAEYGAQFRTDVGAFVDTDIVLSNVMRGVRELLPSRSINYKAFCDPSGGSSDSFALAIGHREEARECVIVDCVREIPAPFSPEAAVAELAQLLKSYNISSVVGDRYAGLWASESFGRHGISYELSPAPKSALYGALLPLLNSERIELPDNARLVSQLAGLERRTARGGRDSIDHAQGGHDDLANVVAGLASLTTAASEGASIELLQRCNDTYDPEEAAQRALAELVARGEPRPLWGPLAVGAVSLGHGGYRVATYEEQCRIAWAEQERIRAASAEAKKKPLLP